MLPVMLSSILLMIMLYYFQRNDSGKNSVDSLSKGGPRHLLMSMKNFMVNVGEESVIFFALYDSKESEYIR